MKKKQKHEKKPSKLKLWKEKMKSTPRGKAILKLIYWGIFFIILFVFLGLTSGITSNYDTNKNNQVDDSKNNADNSGNEDVLVPKTIADMQKDLISKTYKYTYDIHVLENSYLFEGTKYNSYQEGYKNYVVDGNSDIIKYYIDNTGIYQIKGNEKILLDDFYQEVNSNFLNLEYIFNIINSLGLKKDPGNYGYPVYYTKDDNYTYTLNISKDETKITDISIISNSGSTTYLLTFSNIGEYDNE